ncbi:MAG: glycerol-3-phosphate 1-O-acyltransferase PlsY [Clostridia bacterium]|nr:glycerol-3-phosphate 1-O-acyltransferase PlsY [Clostridia bacterium]
MFFNILIFIMCYLICSLNPAIILCKKVTGQDIRSVGSGNAGTTNALRVMGKGWGALVFILDASKAFISYLGIILMSKIFNEQIDISANSIFLIATVLGHCYPVYYSFKGGKGIVTLLISALCINKQIAVVCIIVGVIIILLTRTVSKGTLAGVLLYVIMMIVMMPEYILPVLISSAIVIFRHKENIVRIMNKEEQKLF